MALLSIAKQQCKQAVIEFHSNEAVVYGLLMKLRVGSGDRSKIDVLVCRVRGAREFIRWMVKTFDSRGW
jgi:hypothetical protein